MKKKLIVITGPAGSGKSTVARLITNRKGYNLVKLLVEDLEYCDSDYVVVSGIRRKDELDYLAAKADVKLHIVLEGKPLSDTDYNHESENEVANLQTIGKTVMFTNTYDETFKTTIRMFMYGWLHGEYLASPEYNKDTYEANSEDV